MKLAIENINFYFFFKVIHSKTKDISDLCIFSKSKKFEIDFNVSPKVKICCDILFKKKCNVTFY